MYDLFIHNPGRLPEFSRVFGRRDAAISAARRIAMSGYTSTWVVEIETGETVYNSETNRPDEPGMAKPPKGGRRQGPPVGDSEGRDKRWNVATRT